MERYCHKIILSSLFALTSTAQAAEVYLRADATAVTLPDGAVVQQWGFALDNATFDSGSAAQVPGPALDIPPGDSTLTVHLLNKLPAPVSLIIHGQNATFAPVYFTDGQGRQRVRSLAQETPTDGVGTYTWTGLQPGTYLYQSGTHPAVQVPMGLYGALRHDAAVGEIYPGLAYDRDVVLLFSEIDPALNQAVVTGNYGTAMTSTVNYSPRYFLINGAPYSSASLPLTAGYVGERVLVRMLNAGLETHVPVTQGVYLRALAEDGKRLPYVREQYASFLPAAKTLDALLTPDSAGDYAVYDRRLRLTNNMQTGGGMLAFLKVENRPGAPIAVADNFSLTEDVALNVPAPGLLGNDSDPESDPLAAEAVLQPIHGTLSLNADGSFSYTPALDYNGTDVFSYRARDAALASNTVLVTLNISPVNDAPTAVDDVFTTVFDQAGTFPILANDTDVDGDPLSIVSVSTPTANGGNIVINPDQTVTYMPATGFGGADTFTYIASDGVLQSAPATVTVSVQANSAPIAIADMALVAEDTAVIVAVLANDSDPDGNALTVASITQPAHGATTLNPDGTVTYQPAANYNGADTFSYTVSDGQATSIGGVTITVTPVNDAPIAVPETVAVDTQGAFSFAAPGVLANDSDVDGDALTAVQMSDTANGSVTLSANGGFVFSPQNEWVGTTSFTYRASDGTLSSGLATVTLVKELATKEVRYNAEEGNKPAEWVIKGLSAAPGSSLTFYVGATPGGTVIGTTTVDNAGRFTFRDRRSMVVPDGTRRISIASSTGARLIDVPVTIQGTVPAAAAPLNAGVRLVATVTVDRTQYDATTGRIQLTGEATPNAQLNILVDGVVIGTITADAMGDWAFSGEARKVGDKSVVRVESAGASAERGITIAGDA